MRNPLRRRRRGATLVGALCATLGLVATAVATAAPAATTTPAATPPVPVLNWQPCDNGFFCATATVPLDYARPAGATIHLAVIKHPATDRSHRIGSVFFDPGGPGESGVTDLPPLYPLFPPAIRARFDLVSFDPRGIGQSTVLRCFDTIDNENRLLAGLPGVFPVGAAQERAFEDTYAAFDRACAAHAGPLLAHDTTADVARDMDLLRQAVGDPTMNYFGASYGTYLGATYANLFPRRVRAITLDGNIDPVAWATGTNGSARRLGTFLREGDDEGAVAGLNAFLDLCGRATTGSCAFSAGSPAATHAKWETLLDRLAAHPVTMSGRTFTWTLTVALTLDELFHALPIPNVTNGWPDLARILQTVWAQTDGAPAPADNALPAQDPTLPGPGVRPSADAPYVGREAQLGVLCSESPHPRDPARYPAQSALAVARSGPIGAVWTWLAEPCAQWPVLSPDRYTGPWNHRTAAPILVVGNTVDPSTPYSGSVAMSRDLANARLLTVRGYGHSALANHSTCVDAAEDAYFVAGALPAPGTVCQQDRPPFAG